MLWLLQWEFPPHWKLAEETKNNFSIGHNSFSKLECRAQKQNVLEMQVI